MCNYLKIPNIPNLLFGIFSFLFTLTTIAQQRVIEGIILDASNEKPLSFCNIGISGKSMGTISNENGAFILKIPHQYQKDSIQVSFVGYKSYKIALSEIKSLQNFQVKLTPSDNYLKEVVVMDLTGILQKAIKKIKNNYQHNPAIMEGFYRETVKLSNEDNYFAFAEGVLEMYKAPINNPNDEVRMLKGRKKELTFYFQNEGNICYVPKITNGPNIGILLDFVKDRRSFLHSSDFYWYKFYLEDITTLDDKVIYAISFKPKNGATFFEGTLFIEKESLAFVRAEYKLTDYGLEKVNNNPLNDKRMTLKERIYQVNYVQNEGVWYFHDANVVNNYQHLCQNIPIENNISFVITKTNFENVKRFPNKDQISVDESFNEQSMVFDENFWKDYNIIKEK